jgi:hypothetical protein
MKLTPELLNTLAHAATETRRDSEVFAIRIDVLLAMVALIGELSEQLAKRERDVWAESYGRSQ